MSKSSTDAKPTFHEQFRKGTDQKKEPLKAATLEEATWIITGTEFL